MQLEQQGYGRYIGGVRQPKGTDMIYAVNKETKEHRVAMSNAFVCERGWYRENGWRIIQADADGWIEWRGGECPLPDGSRFDAKTRGGKQHVGCRGWRLVHDVVGDIIAYRPILNDDKPQAPEWDGEGLPPVGIEVEVNHHDFGWVEAITLAMFGGCMVCAPNGGGFYGYSAHEIRPIRTDREEWIDQAADAALKGGDALGNVYDALVNGALEMPGAKK